MFICLLVFLTCLDPPTRPMSFALPPPPLTHIHNLRICGIRRVKAEKLFNTTIRLTYKMFRCKRVRVCSYVFSTCFSFTVNSFVPPHSVVHCIHKTRRCAETKLLGLTSSSPNLEWRTSVQSKISNSGRCIGTDTNNHHFSSQEQKIKRNIRVRRRSRKMREDSKQRLFSVTMFRQVDHKGFTPAEEEVAGGATQDHRKAQPHVVRHDDQHQGVRQRQL